MIFYKAKLRWKLNTSNPGKLDEFRRLFSQHGASLEASSIDLPEIVADALTVLAHKASQLEENILVEDTSLEIDGAWVGINIRWLLDHLDEYAGRQAEWTVLLGYLQGDKIHIYKGVVNGMIVEARGVEGFGFDPVFLPSGATKTLAESKPDSVNARAKAVEALMKGEIFCELPVIRDWDGPWQET